MHALTRLLVLAPAALLTGCYLLHTARGQLQVMSERRPIPAVLEDPKTVPELKARLETVLGIRAFSIEALGLPDNASYRSYADVGRPFVVWNVVATPEFSLQPKQWCFPIAGCVSYRGYFSTGKAADFAGRLRLRGLDVSVAGVAAYSTLGHFADPVLNTMMHWSDAQLAAIVFHELTHQVLYVPGDSMFNEAFATVVEEEGVRRWLTSQGQEAQLQTFLARKQRYGEFSSLLATTHEQLRRLYASELPPSRMRRQKAALFAGLRKDYLSLRATWGGAADFDAWFARPLNNAHLASIATYRQCVPALEALLASEGGDLGRFFERARELARLDIQARHRRLCRP